MEAVRSTSGPQLLLLLALVLLSGSFHSAASVTVAGNPSHSSTPSASVGTSPTELCGSTDTEGEGTPLRIYVYDLHQKFHFGLQRYYQGKHLPHKPTGVVRMPFRRREDGTMSAAGFEHSSEAFLAYDLLFPPKGLNGSTTVGSEVVVVTRPEDADLFFLPFLASMSFDLFSRDGMHTRLMQRDRRLQEELLKVVKASPWWQRSGGHDHIIGMGHPNALRFVRDQLASAIFLVADFGRCPQSVSRLSKDVVVPYNHLVRSFEESPDDLDRSWEQRTQLLYFQGTVKRKNEGYIRKLLYDMLIGERDVHFANSRADAEGILSATQGMRTSRFCLHLAGDTPSSCRLFDAIVSHCVPVIISNKLELPFEATLDYSEFSIFLSHEEALKEGHMLSLLRGMSKEEWGRRWTNLLDVSPMFDFQVPSLRGDATSMVWRDLKGRMPLVRQSVNMYQRKKMLLDA